MASIFDKVWRWVWNTETKYYDGEITRDTDWGGDASTENQPVSGGRVQEWLKNEINGKFGVIRVSSTINEQNFYSLEMFATKEDEALYDEDPETYAGLLTRTVIPISTVQGDSFSAMLATSMPMNDIVVVDGKLEVEFNFRAIRYTQGQASNESARGTLAIQRSTDNGTTWNSVGSMPNVLISNEPTDTTTMQSVDLGSYLSQGKQLIRVRASYEYEDTNSGETRTMNSSWVSIGASVTRTELKLELRTAYHTPMSAKDANGNDAPFEVTYGTSGSVAKTLYLEVTGSAGTSSLKYDLSGSETSKNISLAENATYGYMTHGVKRVKAWMEAKNGLQDEDGNDIIVTSNVLVNRFMVVNENTSGADLTKPYLLLQNVDGEIENFVQANLAEYAVYNPSGENVDVAFLLTSHTTDYESVKPDTEYFRMEVKVTPNTANTLLATAEIESDNDASALDEYRTYFRARRIVTTTSGTTTTTTESDFIKESTGEAQYQVIVDNTNGMTPVTGATFLMNPKVRSNSESDPKRILNAKNNNAVVASTWDNFGFINDGWMTDANGNKVLRVMAGSTLTIERNVWAQFRSNPASSMTFEIDFRISNVTNTTDPILQMLDGTSSSFRGLKLNALEGWLMNATEQSKNDTLFAWGEDERIHLSINLNHQVFPNKGDVKFSDGDASLADDSIALARVIMNGDCVREVPFSITNKEEWNSTDEGSIIIGNEGADIDIYSIRIYEGKQVEMTDVLNRNYLATLTTSAEKVALREKNDLIGEGGLIDFEKAKNKRLNCYVWHGVLPYKKDTADKTGWVEIWRYDSQGNYLPEYSGKICETTKSLKGKGQGTTAKTYYDWNLQEDSSKVEATIQVALASFHSEIHVSSPYTGDDGKQYVDIYGGNLGKNIPIETEDNAQAYEYSNGMVTVPDGWIDGNGMYRGLGYRVAEGTSLAQKRVIKINYASSMQSHLIGACNTYDLLHRAVVGDTPLQQVIPDAVSAKRTEPFLMFNQEEGGNVYFKGMGTYGAGKADKVTWGFVKKQMPMYALIEGSDNDPVMTNFLVPFDKNTAVYSPSGEGWLYNGQQSWDFDLGNTTDSSDLGYTTDGTLNDDNEVEMPTDAVTQRWADIHNFIYLHSTNLKYFVGTYEEFLESDAAKNDTKYKYWCTEGDQAFSLKRYDFINKSWVNGGLFLYGGYRKISVKNDALFYAAYNRWESGGTGDYSILNQILINELVSSLKKYIKFFINEKSLLFNYCYVLGFLAGTDNSAKNTYYKIEPIGVQMEDSNGFAALYKAYFGKDFDFTSVHQLYFDGDDMDSIFRTNNNSHQTKPYYIDRMHPYADDDPNTCLYEGMQNQLFNFVEKAYEGTGELRSVMLQILNAAHGLVTDKDVAEGLKGGKSLWGFMNKYFFNVQRYFPQIAYMEQARIRYEFPQLLGYISTGEGARGISPITQSLGSQLQNEMQYMNQRVIYMTSYAGYGEWGGHEEHSIGLDGVEEDFSFTPAAMPDKSAASYTFTITPHQYIYPSWFEAGTTYFTNQRTAPGKTCTFTFKQTYTGGDAGIGIHGINYISDLGSLSDKSITGDLIVKGKRLKSFNAGDGAFRASSITFNCNNIQTIGLYNSKTQAPVLNLSKLVRLKSIQARLSGARDYNFPESSNLKTIDIGFTYNVLLKNVPNLNKYSMSSSSVITFNIGQNVGTNVEGFTVQPIVESIYSAQKSQSNPYLQSIIVENIGNPSEGRGWTDFDVEALSWFADRPTCEFKGTIAIKETSDSPLITAVTWDLKNKFNAKFGVVDSTDPQGYKGLLLDYKKREFNPEGATLQGNVYTEFGNTFQFNVKPSSIYENNHFDIGYSVSDTTIASIGYRTGILTVNKWNDTQTFIEVSAKAYRVEGTTYEVDTITKTIEIWNRPAQLGDLVYADGTFSSVESYDEEKTPIGVCFYVPPRDSDGNVIEKYANPKDKQLRLMVALKDVTLNVGGTEETSVQWGAQYRDTGQTSSWNEQYALYDGDYANNNYSNLTSDSSNVSNVYDITSIQNLTTRGLDNPYIDPDPTTNANSGDKNSDYRSTDDEALAYNYGFKLVDASTAIGDGFAYNESAEFVTERTLTDDNGLKDLAGDQYKSLEGDVVVNSAYAKTLKVIQHRNWLLNNNIYGADTETPLINAEAFAIPSNPSTGTELDALGDVMNRLRSWAKTSLDASDTNAKKWSQLAYPFVSACYAYEPIPTNGWKDGEVLSSKFKAHNWFAPTEGLLARIQWYVKYGKAQGVGVISDAIDKLGDKVIKFSTSSYHWSVTESNTGYSWLVGFHNGSTAYNSKYFSCVGRAIAAF